MSTSSAAFCSSALLTKRHRERRRQGVRCVMVDVNQNERDALVVRCPRKIGTTAPQSKRRLRAYSQTWCSSFSPKLRGALELASDRQIRRNASQVEEHFHGLCVTAATAAALSDAHASPGCCCRCVRNSSMTSRKEALATVWTEKPRLWMMRRSFRFWVLA
jgi:hypothetical protein